MTHTKMATGYVLVNAGGDVVTVSADDENACSVVVIALFATEADAQRMGIPGYLPQAVRLIKDAPG